MATALDLISSALRLINVVAAGETTDIATANDALMVLNDMIDSWNADRLAIFTTKSEDFPFVLSQQSYTMGPTGDFDTARPARIDSMSVILMYPNPANPIEVPIDMYTVEDWQLNVPVKKVNGSFPQVCYDDGGYPLRTLNFWPIPSDQPGNLARIYSWQALAQPAALNSPITFPPGYRQAFRFNLATLLAAEFAQPIPPTVAAVAIQSLATVKTMNAPELELKSDLVPSPAGWNYKADMFNIPY